jgi:hypothetical protein
MIDIAVFRVELVVGNRYVADFDGVSPSFDPDYRSIGEMMGKGRGVDGSRGDDEFQIGPLGEDVFQETEQKVDIQTPFMGLIQDNHPISF